MFAEEDNIRIRGISFLRRVWFASLGCIAAIILLCHFFADWAKWFPVVTEPEFIRFWFPKPVIYSLNLFLILSIIMLRCIRNMRTVKRHIKKLIDKTPFQESAILHIYGRSVMLSIIIGVLMVSCGGAGFFLTQDYFILYLFVFLGVAFLVINRPRLADIEKIKGSMGDGKSSTAYTPEKKRGSCKKIRFVLLMILLFPVTCTYLDYRNVDPVGGCKGCKNIVICLDALYYSENFSRLPSDDEMIDRFRKHRKNYENMREDADLVRQKIMDETDWRKRYATIVNGWKIFACFPPEIYTDYEKNNLCIWSCVVYFGGPDNRLFAYIFETDRTIYIQEADFYWPHNSHEKGYVYFPIVPKIENGRILGPKTKDGSRITWRLFDRLDGKWPQDMKRMEYRLKQIDPQWFLYISKDNIGG